MRFIALIILCLVSLSALAQDTEIARVIHNDQRTLQCERYETLLAGFDDLGKEEIRKRIEDEITGYDLLLKSGDLTYSEKRIYKKNRGVLRKLLKYQDQKLKSRERREDFCKVAEAAVLGIAAGLGWGANGIMSLAAVPFQTIWKFGRSAVTGKTVDGPGQNHYETLGPRVYGGIASNLFLNDRYLGLAIAHPWIIPLIAAPWIDAKVMNLCRRKNTLRPAEEKYCERFVGFKATMSKLSEPAESAGAWLHKLIMGTPKVEDTAVYSQEEILKDLTQLTNENFCTHMVKIGEKYRASRKEIQSRANREAWRLGLYPERYGVPDIADFHSKKENLEFVPVDSRRHRNLVISLGPAPYLLEGVDQKARVKAYRKKFKEFQKLAKKGRKIFQDSDTIEDCRRLSRKEKFDYETFERLAMEIEEDHVGKKLYEHDVIKGQFKSVTSRFLLMGRTKLKWELIENGDIKTIHELLRSPDVANVVLAVHGTAKGKLIDSQSNEIPRTFFKNLSPSLQSLNFFSCYSQKIDDYYGLSKELNVSRSSHAVRHLSFVEVDDTYSYQAGQVPLASFSGYLSQVDEYMYHSLRGNLLYQNLARNLKEAPASRLCQISVENLGIEKTSFSLTINNVQVGALTPDKKTLFNFDCSILKETDNKLRLLDIQLGADEPLTVDSAEISVIRPEGITKIDPMELNVTRLNGNALGILGTFN